MDSTNMDLNEQTSQAQHSEAHPDAPEQPEPEQQQQQQQIPLPPGSYNTLPPTPDSQAPPLWDRLHERYSPPATEASDEGEGYWQVQYSPPPRPRTPVLRPSPQRVFPGFRREYTRLSDPDLRARFEEWHARNNDQVERNLREGLVDPLHRQPEDVQANTATHGGSFSPVSSRMPSPPPSLTRDDVNLPPALLPVEPPSPTSPPFDSVADPQPGFPTLSRQPNGHQPSRNSYSDELRQQTVYLTLRINQLEAEISCMIADRSRLRQENMALHRQNLELQNVAATRRVDNMILQEEALILARWLGRAMEAIQIEERELRETLFGAQTGAARRGEELEEGEIREDQGDGYEEEEEEEEERAEVPRRRGSI